jgi:U4/U6 small nuclear ribonucleoprotein PRP4
VYALCVHGDGSLVLTGDMGGVVQLWDVRSGRTALTLTGHARAVLCGGWSSAGWCCVTGSEDHSVRVWDIRGKRCMYVLPAHSHSISSALFMRGEYGGEGGGGGKVSECIVTGSYDSSVRVWDAHTMQMVTQLRGHDRMVMRVAIAGQDDGGRGWDQRTPFIASASYDRTWKLYHTTE